MGEIMQLNNLIVDYKKMLIYACTRFHYREGKEFLMDLWVMVFRIEDSEGNIEV